MDCKSGVVMEVAALGRPFCLGMLYDCRRDSLVPGMTLWDDEDLRKYIRERTQKYNDFEIIASESIDDKSSALNVEASLKASFLSGLVEVGGSAKYLNDNKTSKNQARVTLTYKATTKFQQLSMNHLGRENMKHKYVFDKRGIATHVVTGILYGAQAFVVFDREVSEKDNHQDIQGNLEMVIKKIPLISIEGEGSLKMDDKDRENVEKFSCRFYGDFSLEKPPTSFQDALIVYQSLPKLLGPSGEYAVPMKVWLMPLTVLDSSSAKLVRQISIRLVQEAQSVLEHLNELEMRCNDAARTTTVQQFPQIGRKLKSFKQMCSEFKLEFQQNLAKTLPSIRGGGKEEAVLTEILKKSHSSAFNSRSLNEWMDWKEREIYTLMSFTNRMKNTKVIQSQSHLHKEILSVEHAVCFVFTSLGGHEPFLSALSTYLKGKSKAVDAQHPQTRVVEKDQWFDSKEVADEMRQKAKLFTDFAEANKENKNIKFLTVGLTNETEKGSSIHLYKDGFSVTENFEPPSRPETVTVSDRNHNSVTLKVSPPRFGAEDLSSYSVEYCVSGEDGWKQQTAAKTGEVTVSGLSPDTEYVFRCRAVTSVGVGPVLEVSGSSKTLPCSPPGKPQVESNSSEISVIWQKPAELGQDVQVLSYMVEYAQTHSEGEEDLRWKQLASRGEEAIISGLQSETEYAVRVRADCGVAGRSKESITLHVCTTKYKPVTEILKRTSKRINSESPSVYKLPLTEVINISGCRRYNFGTESSRRNRTVILLGATGSGKSTLINAMINYIVGVEWKDQVRFKLTDEDQWRSQAESQTSEVTVYKVNHQEGFNIDYSLTIVDMPGFGDTRGIVRDILSIFGKDVAENIRVLVTFADDGRPPVLEAIKASGVPCPKTEDGLPVHFKFNNSALFAHNKSSAAQSRSEDDDEDGGFDEMFWNMGTRSMKKFFVAMNQIETKSLTLTQEVLREREEFENLVESLQKLVKVGLAKLEEIKETTEQLKDNEAEISRNENFEFEVTIRKPVEVDISGTGVYLTNCQRYKWEYKEVKEKTTAKELKEKYLKATEAKMPVKALTERLKKEYDRVNSEVVKLMERSAQCLNRLKEIALKPDPLSTPEYIDMLIEGEKSEAKPGWKARVESLIDMRKQAEYMAKVERGEKLLQNPGRSRLFLSELSSDED
ncbi:hypothetical protein INR49_010063 [Caranx melampygus]|nr:hypothetical protein INR49_010063 [Caranx melampygus]